MSLIRPWLVLWLVAACGDNISPGLYFTYDPDRYVLCGMKVDDNREPLNWDKLEMRIEYATRLDWVLNLYAHRPGVSISYETLERVLTMIDRAGLEYLRYDDLDAAAPPRPGVLLSFDDAFIDEWAAMRPILDRHNARVTFFVTRYAAFTEEQRAELHRLYDEGHGVEGHGVIHQNAVEYTAMHGVEAYVNDEVLPSLTVLADDGFAPHSFAYPFGARSDEIDAALRPHVRYLRTTAGTCPE